MSIHVIMGTKVLRFFILHFYDCAVCRQTKLDIHFRLVYPKQCI